MRRFVLFAFPSAVLILASSCSDEPIPPDPRINEIQTLGTHNSFHIQPRDSIMAALWVFEPELAPTLEYTHLPIPEQLDHGVRHLELDIFADPEGGRYATRHGLIIVGEDPVSGLPELDEPGMKVLHIQDIDFETQCLTLKICLDQVKQWSDDHSDHLPLMVMIQAKEDPIPDPPDPIDVKFVIPLEFGPDLMDDLDEEIRAVFPEGQLITPDDVRGDYSTLEEAVLDGNWPTLGETRGRVMFSFRNSGTARDHYIDGHPSLEGRVMFTYSVEGEPEAAWFNVDNALEDGERIRELVEAGYLVRTRADEDTTQARENDYTLQEAAFSSGAQFVSTDYIVPNPNFGTDYQATVPGDYVGRCNPISAPESCDSDLIDP